ncbi:DUF559 domain-containing protein [Isoptericola aurantiacus]|uniref:DUF559 domain-containing protein n=1 Tax=Isoptericola aurantiacus TaxID=3377839 RepID=UPI00383B75BB
MLHRTSDNLLHPSETPSLGRPFRVADALARGLPPRVLRRAELDRPFHGLRSPSGFGGDLAARCRALNVAMDDGVVFSHVTALRLHGIDVPWTLREAAADDAPLHVATRVEGDRLQRRDVVSHRTRQDFLEVTTVDGLPVTTPAQTFVHVAADLRLPDDVVILGDAMMRYGDVLTSTAELADLARRTRKVKGIAQVREQIERMCPGTDSVMETRTRLRLTDAGLPWPLVNAVVRLDDGTYVKRCDLLYPEARVVIEYDGDQHRTDRRQWRDDVRRRRWLEELEYDVVVVVADDFTREASMSQERDAVSHVRALLRDPRRPGPGTPGTIVVPFDPRPVRY